MKYYISFCVCLMWTLCFQEPFFWCIYSKGAIKGYYTQLWWLPVIWHTSPPLWLRFLSKLRFHGFNNNFLWQTTNPICRLNLYSLHTFPNLLFTLNLLYISPHLSVLLLLALFKFTPASLMLLSSASAVFLQSVSPVGEKGLWPHIEIKPLWDLQVIPHPQSSSPVI